MLIPQSNFCKMLPFLIVACMSCSGLRSHDDLNKLKIDSPAALHDFFQYTGNNVPIITGHRGGTYPGFPENSIESFEHVLRHTPAFFEIDPRITKDSVIVIIHDATLDRTTTGKGKVADYTWEELQELNLVDHLGQVTPFKIPSLEEVITWSRGKTVINLDRKDVPFELTAALIKKHQAEAHVMLTVHAPEQAQFYLEKNKHSMFSAHIKSLEELHAYEESGIPWDQVMAYVGPWSKVENQELYEQLHQRGVMVMVSAASSYDKLEDPNERQEAYRKIIDDGADVLESDFPIEAAAAISSRVEVPSPHQKYFIRIPAD